MLLSDNIYTLFSELSWIGIYQLIFIAFCCTRCITFFVVGSVTKLFGTFHNPIHYFEIYHTREMNVNNQLLFWQENFMTIGNLILRNGVAFCDMRGDIALLF